MNTEVITILAEKVFSTTADIFLKRARRAKSNARIRFSADEIRDGLTEHVHYVRRWAAAVSGVSLLSKSRDFGRAFVNLDLTFTLLGVQGRSAPRRDIQASDLSLASENLMILGEIGAGKTSSLKRLCNDALEHPDAGSPPRTPILLQFREHRPTDTLSQSILLAMGITPSTLWPKQDDGDSISEMESPADTAHPRVQKAINERVVMGVLDTINALVVLDGLDELDPRLLNDTVEELRRLMLKTRRARFVISCRTAAYVYQLETTSVLEICPLSESQIQDFARNWLGDERARQMLADIRSKPYQGTEMSPLLLSLLCALFGRTGQIPGKPRNVYRTMVNLLLADWDLQRSVRRPSRYADFMSDRKQEFLARLAYEITTRLGTFHFTHNDLESLYHLIRYDFDLPAGQGRDVTREIESHTGLLVTVGHDQYAFSHKAFQEYFCAHYLSRLGRIPREDVLLIPDEIALTAAMSSDAAQFFAEVARAVRRTTRVEKQQFVPRFLRRLAIEGPDFRLHGLLGVAYLEFAAMLSSPPAGSGDVHSDIACEALTVLAEHPNVRTSLRGIIAHSRVSRSGSRPAVEIAWQDAPRVGGKVERADQGDFYRGLPNPLRVRMDLLPSIFDQEAAGN